MINWKVRIKNVNFWISIIPAILLLIQQVLAMFGIAFDYSNLSEQLIAIVGTIFTILSIIGIVTDPTTKGITDSKRAMTYNKPKED